MSNQVDIPCLRRFQPISMLGDDCLRELLPFARRHRFPRGIDPIRERDWTGEVVYLDRGELKLDSVAGSHDVVVGGTGRARMPIARDGVRPAASRAITDVEILTVAEDPLDVLVTWDQVAAEAETANADGTDWHQMSGIFSSGNLTQGAFSTLPPAHIAELLRRFRRAPVSKGDVILRQGDAGDFYYLLERGRCKVSRLVAGTPMDIAELKEGDAFGEEALVSGSTRNATVTMKTDGVLLRLDKADFYALLSEPLLQKLDAAGARRCVGEGGIWLDVRFPAEFAQDGLPGAINMPLNEIRKAASTLDPATHYVAYCQTGRRSAAAAFLLSQRGLKASLLAGGVRCLDALPEQNT